MDSLWRLYFNVAICLSSFPPIIVIVTDININDTFGFVKDYLKNKYFTYGKALRLYGENHLERSAFSVKSIILFCNFNLYFLEKPIGGVAVNGTIPLLFTLDDTSFGNCCNRRV